MTALSTAKALAQEPAPCKPRIFMITDIMNEPDDEMSLVRLLLYSNTFRVCDLCASTSASLRNETHPEDIERIIKAYGKIVHNLNTHVGFNCQFPPAEHLLQTVCSGPKVFGREFLKETHVSDGAKRLIDCLAESEEPLYVGLWGGANTVAEALRYLEHTRSKVEGETLRSRLRVYSISDQDDAGLWIRIRWPLVVYITSSHGFGEFLAATWNGIHAPDNGMTDMTKVLDPWLTPNVRVGPLGAEYPLIKYGMEGDSPSFMWLIPNGLSYPERPDWGGWGGRFNRITWSRDLSSEYGGSPETVIVAPDKSYTSLQASVWRWRDAFQDDLATRMQWTLHQDLSAATHPPIISINESTGPEPLYVKLAPGQSTILDATQTIDVDYPGDLTNLDFEWFFYLEPSCPHETGQEQYAGYLSLEPLDPPAGSGGKLELQEAGFKNVTLGPKVSITNSIPPRPDVPNWPSEWHVILQVRTKKGPYPVRRYKRVVVLPI